MKRIEFIRSSAIVCASVALPRYTWSNSGMYSFLGERRVAQILDAKESMVQNTPILRAFAGGKMDFVSPFVLLDEFGPMVVEPGTEGMQIKAHPHAGVTPTTYLLSGSGRHTDSLNNDIVYRKGQFMLFSSGSGAIHEEVSSEEIKRVTRACASHQGRSVCAKQQGDQTGELPMLWQSKHAIPGHPKP